jgi:hypothetical protein
MEGNGMVLKSGREVVEIQRDGYKEALPISGNVLLTDAEWEEYSTRTLAEGRRKAEQEKADRVKRNHTLFNAALHSANNTTVTGEDGCFPSLS